MKTFDYINGNIRFWLDVSPEGDLQLTAGINPEWDDIGPEFCLPAADGSVMRFGFIGLVKDQLIYRDNSALGVQETAQHPSLSVLHAREPYPIVP